MSLSRDDVEKIALLARLRLDDNECVTMTKHLGRIVDYIEQLNELNTDNVEPMAHAVDISNVLVEDTLRGSLASAEALANAPRSDDECYRVPAVLGD